MSSNRQLEVVVKLAFDRGEEGDSFRLQAQFGVSGIYGLSGPSGAGKTMLLRSLAGLPMPRNSQPNPDEPEQLKVVLAGRVLQDEQVKVPVHQRQIGMVFQDHRLFPHLSVADNLQFAIRRSRRPSSPGDLKEWTEACGVGALLDRLPQSLSGGEMQRAALVRALATKPDLLLMDEPLSALDQPSRQAIFVWLKDYLTRLGIPVLMVSHQLGDLAYITEEMIYLQQGSISAQGKTTEVIEQVMATSKHIPPTAIISGHISDFNVESGLSTLEIGGQQLKTTGLIGKTGQAIKIAIPAAQVAISQQPIESTTILNQLKVTLNKITDLPNNAQLLELKLDDGQLLLSETITDNLEQLNLSLDKQYYALVQGIRLTML